MAFDFPSSPTVGQTVSGYTWDGEKWMLPTSSTPGFVSYAESQSLSTAQKAQARANIGALKKNYIINGAMQVSQENGTTAGTTNDYYAVDQFNHVKGHGGTSTIQQVASVTPGGSPNRLRVTATVADASVAAGDYLELVTKIEGLRVADLLSGTASAKTVTLQFGCKGPAGTYGITLLNAAVNRFYPTSFTISSGEANTDVVKSVTLTLDTAGTWLNDTGVGLDIRWWLMGGSSFQTASQNAWTATANAFCPTTQFNFMGTASNVFELFDVGLYEGSVAPAFQVPDYPRELALCMRYYEGGQQRLTYFSGTFVAGVAQAYDSIPMVVPKRAAPTVTVATTFQYYNTSDAFNNFTPSFTVTTTTIVYSGSGMTNWKAWASSGIWKANARL
jgi:hypothetical protein